MKTREKHSDSSLPSDRSAGVCLHITALPGPSGIGELGDAALGFIDAMAGMNLRVWQFLPTGPTAYGNSPYQPLSSFAGNEMLIDIRALVRAGLLREPEADALRRLPAHTVDFGRVIPAKRGLLSLAASRFKATANASDRSACDAFVDANNDAWLHDYAVFRILKSQHGERCWIDWEDALARRDTRALRRVEGNFAADIEAVKIMQFLFFSQWRQLKDYANEKGIVLFGDMPIYIALDSSDAWANRDLVRLDEAGRPTHVAGVPPDYFSEDGQLWGNPLYDWDHHAADGYRWWTRRLRKSVELADLVRIDHFRGFEAYWSVPADSPTARSGAWVPGPGDAIFAALEASLGKLPIVAEDLGVITPEVDALRDSHHIPGMKVLQFEVGDDDFDVGAVAENCVCYTGTHDNDTTRGWFIGSPCDIRSREDIERTQRAALEITGGRPESIHADMIRLAFSTNARLAIAPMQDYLGLGSEARFNVPGSSGPNWQWRLRKEGLQPQFMESVGEMVARSGRDARG